MPEEHYVNITKIKSDVEKLKEFTPEDKEGERLYSDIAREIHAIPASMVEKAADKLEHSYDRGPFSRIDQFLNSPVIGDYSDFRVNRDKFGQITEFVFGACSKENFFTKSKCGRLTIPLAEHQKPFK